MGIKRCILILCIILLLLPGCGRQRDSTVSGQGDPAAEKALMYVDETWDAGITPGYVPQTASFLLAENNLYFLDRTGGFCRSVYKVSLQEPQDPPELVLQLEQGSIEAMAVDEKQEPVLTIAGISGEGQRFLASYDAGGEELWRQYWNDTFSAEGHSQAITRLVRGGEGYFCALGAQRIWIFDSEGCGQGEIVCPGREYLDLCADGEGQVYATYQDSQGRQNILARVQYQNRKLSGEVEIPFDGSMWAGGDNWLLMWGNGYLNAYSPARGETVEVLDTAANRLSRNEIQDIEVLPGGEALLVSWEMLNNNAPVTMARLRRSRERELTEEDSARTLTLVMLQVVLQIHEENWRELAAAFHFSHKEYQVVPEGIAMEGVADIYAAMNTRLLAKESADLIALLDYQDIERYMAKGYLEDLTPYLERSEQLSRDRYLGSVLQCYMMGDALYSIPVSFSILTLGGRASELGNEPGWTVDEFLDWLEEHPDVQAKEGLSPSNVLNYCLMGGMDLYVDPESRRGNFQGEDFCELLRRIHNLKLDEREHWEDWGELLEGETPVLDRLDVQGFLHCGRTEDEYGEEMVYKGYPTGDGTPCYFFQGSCLAVLSRSTDKEGAYAFWEYYLTHRQMGEDSFYTNLEALEKSMETASDLYIADVEEEGRYTAYKSRGLDDWCDWYPAMTLEQRDKQVSLLEYVRADPLENQTIRNIILEEAQCYFAGDKSLEDTCEIIQSRVQTYLDETA